MDARNFTYMFYGFLAAWLILMLYVVSLARRSARLKKELEDVRNLVASSPHSAEQARFEAHKPLGAASNERGTSADLAVPGESVVRGSSTDRVR